MLRGLGLRQTSLINRALLAKQYWRLLCASNLHTTRAFKGKYYPNAYAISYKP
jgi:hypothetical protein